MKTLEELQAIRDKMKKEIANREPADADDIKIVVGMATCGIAAGARPVINAVSEELSSRGLTKVKVSQTGCMGICAYEPIVEVLVPQKPKVTYVKMTPEKVRTVITNHIINGNVVEEFTYNFAVGKREGKE